MLPIYMTRRPLYMIGIALYGLTAAALFTILVFFYRDIHPWAEQFIPSDLYTRINSALGAKEITTTTIIIIAGIAFFLLMQIDKAWNPLYYTWRTIAAVVSIPRKARHIATAVQSRLQVPEAWRGRLIDNHNIQPEWFEMSRAALERKWAEIAYMREWLSEQHRQTGGLFFTEQSIGYAEIAENPDGEFFIARKLYISALDDGGRDLYALSGQIGKLHQSFSRLVACYVIYQNGTEDMLWDQLESFGVTPDRIILTRPMAFLYYVVATGASVFIGLFGSWTIYDLAVGGDFSDIGLSSDFRVWTAYSVGMYCIPILVVILIRYFCERVDSWVHGWHPDFYVIALLIGMAVSGGVVTLGLKYWPPPASPVLAGATLLQIYKANFLWTIAPGIMTAFVAYRMDAGTFRDNDGDLDVLKTLQWALIAAIAISVVVGLVIYAEWATIVKFRPHPEKFAITAMATVFMIGLSLGVVSGAGRALSRRHRPRRSTLPREIPAH